MGLQVSEREATHGEASDVHRGECAPLRFVNSVVSGEAHGSDALCWEFFFPAQEPRIKPHAPQFITPVIDRNLFPFNYLRLRLGLLKDATYRDSPTTRQFLSPTARRLMFEEGVFALGMEVR